MPLSAWLAVIDALASLALLLQVPRQRQNKLAVLLVASILLGVAGWLGAISVDSPATGQTPPSLPPVGRQA